ncbi:MAG: S9 family peptidase, partial [Parvularculaceae bacterium]
MFRKKAGGKIPTSAADGPEQVDPHLWLEDVGGERALSWVKEENARSLAELEGDGRFKAYLSAALDIVNASDRTPAPALFGAEVRNFWQDEFRVRGLWRRTTLETYLRDAPQWTPIIDFDALGALEGENWVFAGATSLAPSHDRAIVALSRGGADAAVRR